MVRRLFQRIGRTCGNSSQTAVDTQGRPVSEHLAKRKTVQGKRFRRLAKKSKGRNRRASSPMGTLKFGVRVPNNVHEALELDKINGNNF